MILDDLATYIDTNSTALSVGASGNLTKAIALDATPAPATLVTLYETPGVATEFTFSTGTPKASVAFERPSIQVLSRSTSYVTARMNAQTVFSLLDGIGNTNLPTSTGTLYHEIVAAQPPFLLQRDENDRFIVACNFNVRKASD